MIHIYYRAANFIESPNKCRPFFFNLEKCFKNLLDTLDVNTQLNVIFDGNLCSYEDYFIKKYQIKYQFRVFLINGGSDFNSNTLTCEKIKENQEIKENDLIYLLEHDYLHRQDWSKVVLDIYNRNINFNIEHSYISLYDHSDKYTRNLPNQDNEWGMYSTLKSQIYLSQYGYVRETPSSCGSFLMKKSLFDKDYDIHVSKIADNSKFHILTKEPYNRKVLSFMPGFSTHLHSHYMSPYVDWSEISENIKLIS